MDGLTGRPGWPGKPGFPCKEKVRGENLTSTLCFFILWSPNKTQVCLSSGLHPSEEHLKASYITAPHEVCPSLTEDAPLRSFTASHIPRFFACPKKKKEREKMATSRGVDRHFRGPGRQKWWRKGKHLVTQPGNAPKTRPSRLQQLTRLTRSLWRTRLQRPHRPSPSEDADLNWHTAIQLCFTFIGYKSPFFSVFQVMKFSSTLAPSVPLGP